MIIEFRLPDIGEGLAEAEIIEYLVKEGDIVKADQPVVKIENDKALVELPSPAAGRVVKIMYKAGVLLVAYLVLFLPILPRRSHYHINNHPDLILQSLLCGQADTGLYDIEVVYLEVL